MGAGLMVGTALGVIIPEGAGAFYSAYPGASHAPEPGFTTPTDGKACRLTRVAMHTDIEDAPHGLLGLALIAGFLMMLALDSVQLSMSNNSGGLVSDVKPESSG